MTKQPFQLEKTISLNTIAVCMTMFISVLALFEKFGDAKAETATIRTTIQALQEADKRHDLERASDRSERADDRKELRGHLDKIEAKLDIALDRNRK